MFQYFNVMPGNFIIFYFIGILATLLISGGVYFFSGRRQYKISMAVVWIFIAASGYLLLAQLFKYKALHMYVDFAHWLQVLQSISAKGWPEVLSHEFIFPGTLNYFAAHFVPFIYVFALPFKLIPRPETLLVLNVALMLSSAIPLYFLAKRMQGSTLFALTVAAFLLWYPTFQYITLYEFEMLRFSIPILLWMLYFWESKKIKWYFVFAFAAILVREEVGLTVAMFGLYLLLFQKRRLPGLATFLMGLISFLVIFKFVMPAFSNAAQFEHIGAGIAPQFGNTLTGVVYGIIRHPSEFFSTILHPVKLANVGMLFIPLLFVPFVAPTALLGALANIGIGLLSSSFIHSSYMLYYIAPSIPFIFYALLKAWPKVVRYMASWKGNERRIDTNSTNREFVIRNISEHSIFVSHSALMNTLLSAVLVSNIFFGPSPLSLQFWFKNIQPAPFRTQDFHWSVYRVTDHHKKVEKFVRMIPDDAIVSAQEFLQPRLFKKRGAMPFPQIISKDGQYQASYVFVDRTNNNLKPESPAYMSEEEIDAVVKNGKWEFIAEKDGYELYKLL